MPDFGDRILRWWCWWGGEVLFHLERILVEWQGLSERRGRSGGAEAVVREVDERHLAGVRPAGAATLPRAQLQAQRHAQTLGAGDRGAGGAVFLVVVVVLHHRVVEGL